MKDSRTGAGEAVVARWDEVFRALAAEPRRQLIVALQETDPGETVALPEAAMNPNLDTDVDDLRIALYHRHLPMLAETGFIEWGSDPLVATRGPRFPEAAAVFEAIDRYATDLPAELVVGCRHLEALRQ